MTLIKGQDTRTRILDVAQEAVLAKGFEATSIEEIIAAVEITRSGFFYHFPDKNALACALIERHMAVQKDVLDDLMARARDLPDDPLQAPSLRSSSWRTALPTRPAVTPAAWSPRRPIRTGSLTEARGGYAGA